jgi:hypothetical protein
MPAMARKTPAILDFSISQLLKKRPDPNNHSVIQRRGFKG